MEKVFIITPVFNGSKTIEKVLDSLLLHNYRNIVVVNDGSIDDTIERLKNYDVYTISHIVNLGQGAALRTGTEFALKLGAETIVHFDADDQHPADEIVKLLGKLAEGYDIALGSRFIDNRTQMPWTKKYLILKPAIMVNYLFSGLKLTDAHNGFRAMSRFAAEKIQINQNRMAHASEITSEIKRHGLKYAEVSVKIRYHQYGQNWKGGLKVIADLIKQRIIN
ncbi:hypothetical protein A2533_05130 [Candidatus Falkowbacteria bacterium RIFOXYD2_FULL_35_9]|uniref:Glycosyltransferase 2-like domain-containing protein n=1 Tax=Candidatus Falkowbacteria bacterium RIFOXYC2_FULL_36_12 TaxID=1798002 RepID=A0A1F5T084_9BACT|nr:MAG: hypothetical protein A2300_03500 [Candidatus Falkowbacteria bacterium RIFOXYB2_FULL_35_7]OGF32358.1 MAG: hypothetical protein A2478_03495 [Candidatus Falkowbacteria bacterium RIFOXYC2_FULL_36_12]OGF33253.1 MAG: hypothetical protein A2223_03975 [Candidatus Falkowbacteria bacterium RIFOXYA2_FULL_35_8]OGF46472.1 MAG: hypothetical protein A2533_05130 [Candidatus Falkowbacteria bacterium RIFOXYD2_FULL_35_9]